MADLGWGSGVMLLRGGSSQEDGVSRTGSMSALGRIGADLAGEGEDRTETACRGALTEGGVGAQLAVVALEALASAPAVVAAPFHQVHLLVLVLAHVPAEQAPTASTGPWVSTVEGAAPHIAHAQGVDLGPRSRVVHERVVGRDSVGQAALLAVHVDAKHLAQQRRPAAGAQSAAG